MLNQFTDGPWLTKEGQIYDEAQGRTLAVVYDLKHDADSSEEEANSRLIAAAPALCAALKAIEAGFADGSIRFTKKRQADSDPYHPANTAMCEALALANI